MKHVRWYDRNPDLKDVFEFIEALDEQSQNKIAQDILHMLMSDFHLDLDEKINSIYKNYKCENQRWYDHNIDLFTSFEIIKSLPSIIKAQIIEKIAATILLIYFEEEVNG